MSDELPEYSRFFPRIPENVNGPGIEDGLPFVETKIGRLARYVSFFRADGDQHREAKFRDALALALENDGVCARKAPQIAELLIEYAPVKPYLHVGDYWRVCVPTHNSHFR